MKQYTAADLHYDVASQNDLDDILDFLNDDQIDDPQLKHDVLWESPDVLIARERAMMVENMRRATLGKLVS
jgi:hypothetical protein